MIFFIENVRFKVIKKYIKVVFIEIIGSFCLFVVFFVFVFLILKCTNGIKV